MKIRRRSFSILIKMKGSKKNPDLQYQEYAGAQVQMAMENGEDYKELMDKEVLNWEDKEINLADFRRHIKKSIRGYLNNLE